jgi:pleiotropic regulator 1
VKYRHQQGFAAEGGQAASKLSQALMRKKEAREIKPDYHAQCRSFNKLVRICSDGLGKLTRVISGHMGWVRAVAVDPGNQWFATGAGDRVVKVS